MPSRIFPTFLALLLSTFPAAANDQRVLDFVETCRTRLTDNRTLAGDADGWFFPTREIKQLSLGNFWEKPWAEVSRNQSDPVPSMIEFHQLLAEKNVKLLIVPVPAKATIYPGKFAGHFAPGEAQGISPFMENLRKQGLNVVDLEPLFLEMRTHSTEKLWCAQDAHYSPAACVKIADLVADILESEFGMERHKNTTLCRSEAEEISILGDLVAYSEWQNSTPQEIVDVQYVSRENPLQSNAESPVLLLGDSHTLVFSDAENFHCESAGLFDHLSAAMGSAIDLEGSASGGLVTSRINLYRKAVNTPGYWDRKKVVVWVFTAREFTQSSFTRGFVSIPIER